MVIKLIIVLLIIFAAISKAIQDKIQFHFDESIFSKSKFTNWWNPKLSHRNKWKRNGDVLVKNDKKLWYYLFLYFPKYKESFPYSSTFLVSLTDAWHLFGLIRNLSLVVAISLAAKNGYFLLLYPIFAFVFHIFFVYLFVNKK